MSNYGNQFGFNPYGNNNGPQYDYMGGYRNYMPPNYFGQNQGVNGPNQPMPTMPPAQPQQINNNMQFVLVPNIEYAEKVTAEKGQTIYMMNQNKPEIYAKAADGFGLQSSKYFRLLEFDPNSEKQSEQLANTNFDYIPREEYNRFVAAASTEIEALKKTVNALMQAPNQQNIPMQAPIHAPVDTQNPMPQQEHITHESNIILPGQDSLSNKKKTSMKENN